MPPPQPIVGDLEVLATHLAAQNLGTYLTNQAVIKLAHGRSFWDPANVPSLGLLSVFLHEYVHYLHNFSTVAGIYGFVAQLRLTRLFMHTVDATARSHGQAALDAQAQVEFQGAVDWRQHLAGDSVLDANNSAASRLRRSDIQIAARSVRQTTSSVRLGPQIVDLHHVDIDLAIGDPAAGESCTVRLGSHLLMEGLAWEVERLLHVGQGVGTSWLDREFAVFPYKVSRFVFESLSGCEPSSEEMARCILLALQTSDPGASFVAIAEALRTAPVGQARATTLDQMTTVVMGQLKRVADAVCNETLKLEVAGFVERGPAGSGFALLSEWCREFLSLRIEQPFFELELLAQGVDREGLLKLFKTYPPCPIYQQTGPLASDVELVLLTDTVPDEGRNQALGAAQGLMQFAMSHTLARGFVPTAKARHGPCRFYGVCHAPLALAQSDICRERPWEAFTPETPELCWYASGVSAARTRSDLT